MHLVYRPVFVNSISPEKLKIQLISSAAFTRLARRNDVQTLTLSIYEIKKALGVKTSNDQ